MNQLIIIGASGHGKVISDIAGLCGYERIQFLDDNRSLKKCGKYPVIGIGDDFFKYVDDTTDFFVGIGDAKIRKRIQEKIKNANGRITRLIHPNAVIADGVRIYDGTVVMAGVVINSGTVVGGGVIVNTSSSIDHDCIIGDYCHIAVGAHICGTVMIDNEVWVGAGATVSNNVNICGGCMIGAGAVVVKDINVQGTYLGVPVKRKKNSK